MKYMLCVLIRIASRRRFLWVHTINHYYIEDRKNTPKLYPFASWHGSLINPQLLELLMSRTNSHSHKNVRAIEVRLYIEASDLVTYRSRRNVDYDQTALQLNSWSGPSLSSYAQGTVQLRLSLSRLGLSRITAYLEVKIWSLFLNGYLRSGNKILSLFHTIFNVSLSWGVKIHYSFLKFGCSICSFLNFANLTCHDTAQRAHDVYTTSAQRRCNVMTLHRRCISVMCPLGDILKYFREPLGLRDNESRLYLIWITIWKALSKGLIRTIHVKIRLRTCER